MINLKKVHLLCFVQSLKVFSFLFFFLGEGELKVIYVKKPKKKKLYVFFSAKIKLYVDFTTFETVAPYLV